MADRKEYFKQYKLANKEKLKIQNAEWYQSNKEHVAAVKKQYRLDNIDKINAHNQAKITCDVCGSSVSMNVLARHKRTKKCMDYMC